MPTRRELWLDVMEALNELESKESLNLQHNQIYSTHSSRYIEWNDDLQRWEYFEGFDK